MTFARKRCAWGVLAVCCALALLCCLPGTALAKAIYVGDSRTALMAVHIGAADALTAPYSVDKSVNTMTSDGNYIIAKGGQGLTWLKESGLPQASEVIMPGDSVVILVGVNSLPASDADECNSTYLANIAKSYINAVKAYVKGTAEGMTTSQQQAWANVRVYFATVTPVMDAMAVANDYSARNKSVTAYNTILKNLVSDDSSLGLLDLSAYFLSSSVGLSLKSGYGFTDGMHYTFDISYKMYGYLNQQTMTGSCHATFPNAGWHKEGSYWYLADSDGQPLFGWQKVNGKWYWLGYKGRMAASSWLRQDDSQTYYWCYLKANGAMAASEWCCVKGTWYRFSAGGRMLTGWAKIDGKWYYLRSSGAMATGWLTLDGKRYYLTGSGAMAAAQWLHVGNAWYYLKANGEMAHDEWVTVGGKCYYLKSNGVMATGKVTVKGKTYKLSSTGARIN